ncbi:MAG: hypothetical protein QXW35_04210 [Candidatus Aenigmatarchaeota archaeon]
MFGLLEPKIKSPIYEYRNKLDIKEDIIKYIHWLADKLGFKVLDIKIEDVQINFQDWMLTLEKLKYEYYNPILDKKHVFTTYLFKFIDNYIILNGLRYIFVFSQTDKAITRFGSNSIDIKISNLYRKVVFKNALSEEDLPIKYESKFLSVSALFMLIILMQNYLDLQSNETDIYRLHEEVYKKFNLSYTKELKTSNENTKRKNSKKQNTKTKIYTVIKDDNIVEHHILDYIYTIDLSNVYNSFIRRLIKYYNVPSRILNMYFNKNILIKKAISEFKALFDPFTGEQLNVIDYKDFLDKYIFNARIVDVANQVGLYTDATKKQITVKQFLLYPLVRQIAHIIFMYNLYGISKIPLKHNITLSILFKSMQIELADGHLNNPAAEYALNTKITYMHKFAVKRTNSKTRLITNLKGIIDPIATPETKKTGANNYLVVDPILPLL